MDRLTQDAEDARLNVLAERLATSLQRSTEDFVLNGGGNSFDGVEPVDMAACKLQADRELRSDDENDGARAISTL